MEVDFRHQRAAGFAPQVGVHQDGHVLEGFADHVHVVLQVWRSHAGIGAGEAAADIDNVNRHARLHDDARGQLHRIAISRGAHALRADMERHAELVGKATRLREQGRSRVLVDAELAAELVGGVLVRHRKPHDEGEIFRAAGGRDDLLELGLAVEREDAHAVLEVRPLDRLARLHRMHEGHLRVRITGRDELDLSLGGDVEPAQPGRIHGIERPWGRVRLDGVEHFARKFSLEPGSRYRNPFRPHACDRQFWESIPDQVQGRLIREQFT